MEKKKFLFVTRAMSNEGAERVISRISKELILRGYDVAIFIYIRTPKEYEIDSHVSVYSMGSGYSEEYGNPYMRAILRVKKIRWQ